MSGGQGSQADRVGASEDGPQVPDVPSDAPDEIGFGDEPGDLGEPDDAALDGPPPPTIFVTDPTVEAARVEWALRARGYDVIDVPLAMLAGRVSVQKPHLILLDVDAPGALEIAARVRQLPGASGVHLIYAGVAGKTFESAKDALLHEGSGFFARPVDVDALVAKVGALLGDLVPSDGASDEPASFRARSSPPPAPPPSLRAPPSPVPPRPAELPPAPEIPRAFRAPSEPPEAPSSDPARLGGAPKTTRAAEARLSPDLERLLREAEARVAGPVSHRGPESVPHSEDELLSPDEEVEAVLPAEILASLDEPLDLELEDSEGGSSETGGTPQGTTGRQAPERDGARTSAGREHTQGDRAGTYAAQTTSSGRAVEATSSGRAAEATSSGRAAEATSSGRAAEATSSGRAAEATSSGRAAEATSSGRAVEITGSVIDQAPPVRRDLTTPKPPRRAHTEDRGLSQVSPQGDVPAPGPEHAPPLAPQTSRPPALRSPEPPRIAAAEPPPIAAPEPPHVELPQPRAITSPDEALRGLASAVASRVSGVLRFDEASGIRRVVLQDGDVVTAASSVEGESLLGYLVARGDLPGDVARKLEGRVPPFGRLAGAALVAHGHLHQDQLWDVLQAHAAWLLTRAVAISRGRVAYEAEPPQRLRGEPPVFGGTPGPALIVEIVRRAVPPPEAVARLGGLDTRFAAGPGAKLLDECGLDDDDDELLRRAVSSPLRELVEARGDDAPPLLYAIVALGILETLVGIRPGAAIAKEPAHHERVAEVELADPLRDAELDDAAIRARVAARRALVEDGDYFAILGVPRDATGYEIKRAYLDVRRALEPSRLLRPSLLDLNDDLRLVLSVLDEAYDVLKDATRRERYRRAITHEPPK